VEDLTAEDCFVLAIRSGSIVAAQPDSNGGRQDFQKFVDTRSGGAALPTAATKPLLFGEGFSPGVPDRIFPADC